MQVAECRQWTMHIWGVTTSSLENFSKQNDLASISIQDAIHNRISPHLKSQQPQIYSRTSYLLPQRSRQWTFYYSYRRISIQWICHFYPLWSMAIKFMDFLLFTFKDTQILLNIFARILWPSNTRLDTNWIHSNTPFS